VHLVEPGGRVSLGAAAVFGALALAGRYPWLARLYRYLPGMAGASEAAYRLVAGHREVADRLDMLLIGPAERMASYQFTRRIFLRLLGLIFLAAFISAWVQIDGLMGSRGILSVQSFLAAVRSVVGSERYWQFPTLCWLNASDGFLHFLCGGGVVASVLLILGIGWPALGVSAAFYLSLAVAGQDFFYFQWDYLLVEAGFLATFFAPVWFGFWRRPGEREPSRVVLLLLRWLLFRVMFMSGVVKLASGDASWRAWTAMRFHYMTQPLPSWISWYFFQLPAWFQTFSCGVVFLAELVIPFLIFGPRRVRLIAFWGIIIFQMLIAITGNYGFFNLLTILLCCTLPDDAFWAWLLRRRTVAKQVAAPPRWRGWIVLPLGALLLAVTIPECVDAFGRQIVWPRAQVALAEYLDPFRIANGYGLFAVMTTGRLEIDIQGSNDGLEWKAYAFKWKPGDVDRAPAFTTPHMPRLDWQMWFAALGDISQNRWMVFFMERLREGSEPVLGLLRTNPFPDHPPKYVRAVMYDYQFTDMATRRSTGAWWKRQYVGIYYELQPDETDQPLR